MGHPRKNQTITYTYDQLNRLTQKTYDNLSRLLSALHQSGSTTLDGATYTVDSAGNRTAKTDQYANVSSNYTYDPIYELTQATQGVVRNAGDVLKL